MTRIITWLTATLVVVALITYYQINLSGAGDHAHGPTTADCGTERPQALAAQTLPDAPQSEPSAAATPPSAGKAGDPCANSDHGGKPGERK